MKLRQLAAVSLATIATAGAAWSADFDLENPDPRDLVASETIRSQGLRIDIPGREPIVIVDVLPRGDGNLDCLVHIPSLREVILADPDRFLGLGGHKTIELQLHLGQNQLYCALHGKGCKFKIKN